MFFNKENRRETLRNEIQYALYVLDENIVRDSDSYSVSQKVIADFLFRLSVWHKHMSPTAKEAVERIFVYDRSLKDPKFQSFALGKIAPFLKTLSEIELAG
jgi:hypothetical protein